MKLDPLEREMRSLIKTKIMELVKEIVKRNKTNMAKKK
jgi:hypothetical protein